ncbi:hypothetical protein LRY29_00765 [Candidatus Saccharibacteria bacterium]|nr:hypothetical protein [Candidatus Saccharibacteria bacterium]
MTRETDRTPERLPQKTSKLEAVIDTDQVDAVLDTLMEAYSANAFPYHKESVRLPQDERHMPRTLEYGTKEHAMYLWNTCYYMRGGTKSTQAFRALSALFDERPDLFDCNNAQEWGQDEIEAELKSHGLGFQKTVSKHWIENSERMRVLYDGDPRNIFRNLPDSGRKYDELVRRIKRDPRGGGFYGFREKMTSMITYYLMDAGLVETFNFPIPVDLHVARVSIANGLVHFPGIEYPQDVYGSELMGLLREAYFDYGERHSVSPLDLCNAVWLLSESLCGMAPGNRVIEPNGRENREGRLTKLIPEPVRIDDPALISRYEKSCRHCPVEATCDLNVHGGAMYYAAGQLAIRGYRERFPDPGIFPPSFLNETT